MMDVIQEESAFVEGLQAEIAKVIVGQRRVVDRLLIGLLTGGHILLEGVPGLAKTLAVKTVSEAIQARWDASRAKRKISQPVAASAGCIFKNPAETPAGKLVDELGLKGCTEGKARVSEVHGNFIVNGGGATASDVLAVIDRIKALARETRGIELETEVKVLGQDEFTF
jgi:UDP-N-acetylenolpyruvoylglucosamine reductase